MKRIAFSICALVIVTILFIAYQYRNIWKNNDRTDVKEKVIDTVGKPVSNFITFIVDDGKEAGGKFDPIQLFSLDSVGWGKRYDIVLKEQRQTIDQPVMMIQPNKTQTPFLLYPGDSVRIKYAQTDTMKMYVPGDPVRSSELDFFRQLVLRTGNIYYFFTPMPYHQKAKSLSQIRNFEKDIDSVKTVRMSFLAYYQKKNRVRKDFITAAINCIQSTAIDDSLLLYQNNREQLISLNLYLPLAKAKVLSLERIGFKPYPMFIQASKHALAMVTGANPHVGTEMDSIIFSRRFNFIEKTMTGSHRNFSLAHTMNLANKSNVNISPYDMKRFQNLCTDKGYLTLVQTIMEDDRYTKMVEKGANKLLSINGKSAQDIEDVFRQYRGKLIFIDIWASWCAPCLQELPYISALKTKYKDQEIVFVSISTDNQVSSWRKAARAEHLDGNDDFLLLNSSSSTFIKQHKIKSIPRYMLLDKTGKMLNNDTPRPSSPKMTDLINRYL